MAALLNGTSSIAAAVSWTGGGEIGAMLDRVEAAYVGPSSLLALPYLIGERTPHDDPSARGCLLGLTSAAAPEDIVLAMLEGVAFSLADGVAALASARTTPT